MIVSVQTATMMGVQGRGVVVEVDVSKRGFPTFMIVGLAGKAIAEAKERVRTAIVNSGFTMPQAKITVNLAPADLPKTGTQFDLPIAIGILAASEQIPLQSLSDTLIVGEVSLDGHCQPIPGILPILQYAIHQKSKAVVLPAANAAHAQLLADQVRCIAAQSLHETVWHLRGTKTVSLLTQPPVIDHKEPPQDQDQDRDSVFDQIVGQAAGKRAIEIAAAGGLSLLMTGPPGGGKTMLARALHELLPPLTQEQYLEVATIASLQRGDDQFLDHCSSVPFRAPHHRSTTAGLIGGGVVPQPGEVTKAHRGILFLDELPEFRRETLDALRQTLEDGEVMHARAHGTYRFPSKIQLVCAANPCVCGNFGHPEKDCTCRPSMVQQYRQRISGPFRDRISMQTVVFPDVVASQTRRARFSQQMTEHLKTVKLRVHAARERQHARYQDCVGINQNSDLTLALARQRCSIDEPATTILENATARFSLSTRGVIKTVQIAQTIADLGGAETIQKVHMSEAIQYRIDSA